MGVILAPETPFAKERRKHEAHYSEVGPPGRPYAFAEYPMMVHLAGRPLNGLGPDEIIETEVIESEVQYNNLRSRGFRPTPGEALDAFKAQQLEFAKLAAERNYDVKKKLSRKAQAEVARHEAEAGGHLPVIPETPLPPKRRKVAIGAKAKAKGKGKIAKRAVGASMTASITSRADLKKKGVA